MTGVQTCALPIYDTDVDGGTKQVASVDTTGSHGTVAITNAGADLTYRPDANFCGADSFKYTLNGGSQATVSVTVTCVDDPPTAVNDSKTVGKDSGATAIDVLANDTDTDGGPKTVASATQAAHGAVSVASDGSNVSYTPAAGYCGDDSFTYKLNGGSEATVSLTVTCVDGAPVAVDDSATVSQSAPETLDVLANDTDADGGPKTVASATAPEHGAATVAADGSNVTYTPAEGYCGADTFTYTLNGGSTATVSITVTCSPDGLITVSHLRTRLAKGKIVLVLRCKGAVGATCKGSLTIDSAKGTSRLKEAAVYGKTAFDIAAGKSKTVRIKAPSSLVKKLRRSHKAIATVVVRLTDPARTSKKKITIIG